MRIPVAHGLWFLVERKSQTMAELQAPTCVLEIAFWRLGFEGFVV